MKINHSHGSGGTETAALIRDIFARHFGSGAHEDAAALSTCGQIAFTTDSFVITPAFFPGGDIGKLAVCGTVNDLLTAGATPRYLSAAFILGEGCERDDVEKIAISMSQAARQADVRIVTGDTKVAGSEIFINTSGIGEISGARVTFRDARAGDALIVSGTLGDHHACVMSARMGIRNGIRSDCAPLTDMVFALQRTGIALHGMRDITRGGLATCLNEIAYLCNLRARIFEKNLPVDGQVAGLCDILGLDPLYMANEGKMLICVPERCAAEALEVIRKADYGQNAAIIGHLEPGEGVVMTTAIGGSRRVPPLTGEALPRIC